MGEFKLLEWELKYPHSTKEICSRELILTQKKVNSIWKDIENIKCKNDLITECVSCMINHPSYTFNQFIEYYNFNEKEVLEIQKKWNEIIQKSTPKINANDLIGLDYEKEYYALYQNYIQNTLLTPEEYSFRKSMNLDVVILLWNVDKFLLTYKKEKEEKKLCNKVLKWQKENPKKSLKQCINELKIDKNIVKKYFVEVTEDDIWKMVNNFQKEYPFKNQSECAQNLDISLYKVKKHWNDQLYLVNKSKELSKGKVYEWQINNPFSSKKECSESTNVSNYEVKKYWNDNIRTYRIIYLIQEYKRNHKENQSYEECSNSTGLSYEDVVKRWKTTEGDNFYRVREYQLANPSNSKNKCSDDLEIAFKSVVKYWNNKLYIEPKSTKMLVKEYQLNHPYSTKKECSLELNINIQRVRTYWDDNKCLIKKPNYGDEIKKLQLANPDIKKIDVCRKLNVGMKLVNKNWLNLTQSNISNKELVRNYQLNHPYDTQSDCLKSGLINIKKSCISLYWDSNLQLERPKKLDPLKEKVRQWQLEHIDGFKTDCAKELNLSIGQVIRRWDKNLSIVTELRKEGGMRKKARRKQQKQSAIDKSYISINTQIKTWLESNPSASILECAEHFKRSESCIRQHLSFFNQKFNEEVQDKVYQYQVQFPLNCKSKCSKDLNISKNELLLYWNEQLFKTPGQYKVEQWQKEHPYGNKKQCSIETKCSYNTVNEHWNSELTKKPINKLAEQIIKWRKKNPKKTKKDCMLELKHSYKTVNKYWNF